MKVEVVAKWGNYNGGEVIDLPESTAKALLVHKVVKLPEVKKAKKED